MMILMLYTVLIASCRGYCRPRPEMAHTNASAINKFAAAHFSFRLSESYCVVLRRLDFGASTYIHLRRAADALRQGCGPVALR